MNRFDRMSEVSTAHFEVTVRVRAVDSGPDEVAEHMKGTLLQDQWDVWSVEAKEIDLT